MGGVSEEFVGNWASTKRKKTYGPVVWGLIVQGAIVLWVSGVVFGVSKGCSKIYNLTLSMQ